ncbi:hypothetical protein SEA_SAHARA_61 [Gordonia phage Sahara]|uniref:Uncharacterized protein n=2 Tax=Caudoviricetes TaxID=2731619 RepID=A0AAE8BIJ3_9CAUD|nr:hypothetical protein PP498_gp61 [Gordonia phage Sahara]QYW00788.1 hypothetical protein SEA_SAHARA_61 [Gordonia phage Sahara]
MTYTRHSQIPRIFAADIGVRNRCATDRHEPLTYNPLLRVTFCACGLITRPGRVGRLPTDHEKCEEARGRRDHHLVCPLHGGGR